jgi:hypothetical protein
LDSLGVSPFRVDDVVVTVVDPDGRNVMLGTACRPRRMETLPAAINLMPRSNHHRCQEAG